MPTELEELVGFLHHGNAQIRNIACENLTSFSSTDPSIFKINQYEPIRDLQMLVKDYQPIDKHAITILINLSQEEDILNFLANSDAFWESLLRKITSPTDANANDLSMLLANLAKSDKAIRLLRLERDKPQPLPVKRRKAGMLEKDASISQSMNALDQLMDCFVKGADGSFKETANYDYLSYFLADLAKHPEARTHFLTPQIQDDGMVPLSKIMVFTEHKSHIRRLGVANALKNCVFDVEAHPKLLGISDNSEEDINLLPYILLPLMGNEEYAEAESEVMLEECQLLPPDKERESDPEILKAHLETLLLFASATRAGRERLRGISVYPIVRECHAHVENESVREVCDRVVQLLMRAEEGESDPNAPTEIKEEDRVKELPPDDDDDHRLVDIF